MHHLVFLLPSSISNLLAESDISTLKYALNWSFLVQPDQGSMNSLLQSKVSQPSFAPTKACAVTQMVSSPVNLLLRIGHYQL